MHRLRDAPGNGTLGRHAHDQGAFARKETHSTSSAAANQPRREDTRIVSFWPGLMRDLEVRSFQLVNLVDGDLKQAGDGRQRVALAHRVRHRPVAAGRRSGRRQLGASGARCGWQ